MNSTHQYLITIVIIAILPTIFIFGTILTVLLYLKSQYMQIVSLFCIL